MQYKKDALYKKIGENSGLNPEYVKQLLNFTIDGIKEWSINPSNIILGVKHLGRFYWKHKNLKRDLETRKLYVEEQFKRHEDHKKFVENANLILGIYEQYHKDKEDIKKIRFGDNYLPKDVVKQKYNEFKNSTKVPVQQKKH